MSDDAFKKYDEAEAALASVDGEIADTIENFRNVAEVMQRDIARFLRPNPNVVDGSEMFQSLNIAEPVPIDPARVLSYGQIVKLAQRQAEAKQVRDAAWGALPRAMQARMSYSGPIPVRQRSK